MIGEVARKVALYYIYLLSMRLPSTSTYDGVFQEMGRAAAARDQWKGVHVSTSGV